MSKKKIEDEKIDFKQFVKNLSKKDGHQGAVTLDDMQQIPFYLSTGDDILDIYISNRKHGGVPGGRITQLGGLEGCVTEDTLIKVKVKQ